jgi:hypothetical protein
MGMNLHNKEFLDLKLFQTFRVSSAFNMHDLIKKFRYVENVRGCVGK